MVFKLKYLLLTSVFIINFQLVSNAQNDLVLFLENSQLNEINSQIKREILEYQSDRLLFIKDLWNAKTISQKTRYCRENNIRYVIEGISGDKDPYNFIFTIWDSMNPLSPKIEYQWDKQRGDQTNYFIDKIVYYVVFGTEKKDIMILPFSYLYEINDKMILYTLRELHADLAFYMQKESPDLEKNFNFVNDGTWDENTFTYLLISGKIISQNRNIISIALTIENKILNRYYRDHIKVYYNREEPNKLAEEIAKKITEIIEINDILK